MSVEMEFGICCLEEYKFRHKITGRDAIELFKKFGVMDYLVRHYDALHTTGFGYCVQDIDKFIANRSA
ncbi:MULTISPECIES: DUF3791 domain-containing protein [unclassified Fibrobacter]|uniref:DUF3791 domain-containing protein n=1 Tax=unclassified Fibrobacter TaxID=2634177 RepID=UPI000BDC8F5E|nr:MULTISPECIES: DUF3791 domain-containing protein [unclassified Fibrobacter]SOE47748.1 Protein of unknown function [Fibrobacter sp. UWT3]